MADQRTAISRVIEANAVLIVQSIIVTPLFKAHLIQKQVFTAEAAEAIFKSNWTDSEQLYAMLSCLRRRIVETGCEVMSRFLKCLEETGHGHLRTSLYQQMRDAEINDGWMQEVGE